MDQNYTFYEPEKKWLPAGNRELIFGFFAVLLGLFTANMVLFGGLNLGFALGAVLSVGLTWGYLHRAGCKGNGYTTALLVLSLIIAAGFGWSSDGMVKFWLFLFLLAGVNLAFCLVAGRNRFAPGSARSLFDAGRTIFGSGLGSMDRACRGVGMAFRSGGELTQRSGAVLAGLGIAVPALAVVIPLLISSDAAFEGLVDLLPDFDLYEIVATAIAGGVLGLFFYARAVSLRHGEQFVGKGREPKKLAVLTMNTALGAVCAVYLAYLFSQLAYFVGGFSGILPEGFTRAEYARRGFFEMTCLAGVNLALMTFGVGKVRHEGRTPGTTRMLCLFIGLVTEFLAASSAAKMVMYIGTYGLTRLRVLTMVIMVFLGITTAIVCVWLYLPKLQYMKAVMILALAMGAAVLWADVDTQVAKYNVDHYLSGELATVDMEHLTSLGPGAVPYVEKLANSDKTLVSSVARANLRMWYLGEAEDFRGMSYMEQRALEILEQYWPKETGEVVDIP
ncbi:MAG: DUF4173 domain-containing protein [Oscillospiraceae bacterium]|nr:DUF4173 domain-containing protein [Oscillospiraceae bacterium]